MSFLVDIIAMFLVTKIFSKIAKAPNLLRKLISKTIFSMSEDKWDSILGGFDEQTLR